MLLPRRLLRTTTVVVLILATVARAFPQPQEEIFRRLFPVQPPHCTKTPIVLAQASQSANEAVARGMQMQFYIGLHTTVCFRLDEDGSPFESDHDLFNETSSDANSTVSTPHSWLHTIRLDKLEHHHPITQKYVFGIPEVRASCKCECNVASDVCSAATHQFTTCPAEDNIDPESSCYRTFFSNQAPTGCPSGSQPKLCCDLKFRPYNNASYTAVKLEQPSTFATFVYTAYDWSQGRWIEKDRSTITSQLDGGSQDRYLDALKRIELSVSAGGRASHQLESGMYFARTNDGGEMDELRKQPLNEISENNFERLGWYRRDATGHFSVNNGVVRLNKVHNAKVENCKEQTYKSILDANYYMPERFHLAKPIEQLYPWILSARLHDGSQRHAIVTHSEGTNLHITLQVTGDDGHRLQFFHNASKLQDFSGTIIVDSRSNRYFNVTVHSASGKINGALKWTTHRDSGDVHTFTAYVNDLMASDRSMIIALPAIVDAGRRMVCLRADETPEERSICKVVEYHESPLEVNVEDNTWHELVGHCPECNQISLNGLVKYLNPLSWANGVSSISEFVMMATDLLVYIIVLVILYAVITKIVIPLVKCVMCPYGVCLRSSGRKRRDQDYPPSRV